jgi:RNA polymerase sigma factor (sigma-70 family)
VPCAGIPIETAQMRGSSQLTDLVRRVAQGDEPALKELFERTSPKLFGICLRILNDKQDAEDALQDVYVSVWRRAASFDADRSSPITWLATIARNRSIDRLRSGQRHRSSAPLEDGFEIADSSSDSFQVAALAQEGERLRDCMDKLETRNAARSATPSSTGSLIPSWRNGPVSRWAR